MVVPFPSLQCSLFLGHAEAFTNTLQVLLHNDTCIHCGGKLQVCVPVWQSFVYYIYKPACWKCCVILVVMVLLFLCCHGNSGEPQRSTGSLSRSLIDDDDAFSSAASSFTPNGSTGNCE